MTVLSLGSLRLNTGMLWEEEHQYSGIVQSHRAALGGRAFVYTRAVRGLRPITLVSGEDQGLQTYATVAALERMSQDPAASFQLVMGSRSFDVFFRHFDAPVLTSNPIVVTTEPRPDMLCRVTIKLFTHQ